LAKLSHQAQLETLKDIQTAVAVRASPLQF